jgi:dynein heavy chain, axonemal
MHRHAWRYNPPASCSTSLDTWVQGDFESMVEEWCNESERVLNETEKDSNRDSEDTGPRTELEWWRSRMAKLNSIMEELKSPECQVVFNVLQVIKARALKRWRLLNNQITDAVNEAKDNVKYLSTLDKVGHRGVGGRQDGDRAHCPSGRGG